MRARASDTSTSTTKNIAYRIWQLHAPLDAFMIMASVVTCVDAQMVSDIRDAIKECSERGLAVASKWYDIWWYDDFRTLIFSLGRPSSCFRYRQERERYPQGQ
jgi:hypothetical protein